MRAAHSFLSPLFLCGVFCLPMSISENTLGQVTPTHELPGESRSQVSQKTEELKPSPPPAGGVTDEGKKEDEKEDEKKDETLDFSPLTSMALAREIILASESKLVYDWRRSTLEATLGYGYADEANSFNAEAFDLGVGIPLGGGLRASGGLRRILVYGTPSTNLLGKTPYLQESTMTRLELYGGMGLSLLEGRSISILSTWLGDLEQALFGVVQFHISQDQENYNPLSPRKPKQKLGQKPVSAPMAFELGLRMHVYTVFDWGLYLEWLHMRPLKSGEYLTSWNQLTGGLLWSLP